MTMIDLHLHILPGVDDGASNLDVAGSMFAEAKRQGFTHLVATPHLIDRLSDSFYSQVQAAIESVRPIATNLGIDLLLGFEVLLTPDLPQRLSRGEPSTLAGSTAILIELPLTVWPTYTETTLFELQTAGYRPILAHPERYGKLQRDPDLAMRLAEQGVALQVTTSAINGLFGKSIQRVVDRWLQAGAVHLVASDAHSRGRRMMDVPAALSRLERLVGTHEVRRLTTDAPRALLTNTAVPRPMIEPLAHHDGLLGTVANWFKR